MAQAYPYETRLNVLFRPLEVIDERALSDACTYKWYNQTLCAEHPALKPLYAQALAALRRFDAWSIRNVPRAENARADALVNAALDGA